MRGGEFTNAYKSFVGGNEDEKHGKHWRKYQGSIVGVGFTESECDSMDWINFSVILNTGRLMNMAVNLEAS
jgi:hypothetical protein